jgi:hypothetical protein
LVYIELKIIAAIYTIIPSGTKLVPADPKFIPSHQELSPANPKFISTHPKFVTSDPEFVPFDMEFVRGIQYLRMKTFFIKFGGGISGKIYRHTG